MSRFRVQWKAYEDWLYSDRVQRLQAERSWLGQDLESGAHNFGNNISSVT